MALLLLAGLALVPEELLKAAKVDGAGAWQRFTRIILPLMKPAILVALLFRTLDAFRIFDNIFILTAGADNTRSVSILGYDNLFTALNLGIGSTISVLSSSRWPSSPSSSSRASARPRLARRWTTHEHPNRRQGVLGVGNTIILAALVPVLWLASLSFKDPSTIADGSFLPQKWTLDNYRGIFQTSLFTRALVNSIGIALIATVLAVVVGSMAAYAVARLRFPGKQVLVAVTLLIAMFPAISLVSPLFNLWRQLGLFDTWPGLIIPYLTFSLPLAIYTLSAFFREIPGSWSGPPRSTAPPPSRRSGR